MSAELEPTTEVVVTCSYCGELTRVPFRHGAVIPRGTRYVSPSLRRPEDKQEPDHGVRVWVPTLYGSEHFCQSERAVRERELAK